ncbi:cytochrome C oxidase subunit IV family protein [Mycobacterium sp. BMJ-28]
MQTPEHPGWAPATVVWATLVALTLASWTDSTFARASILTTIIVIGLSAFKVVLVVASYMEIAAAPRWLQALCGLWMVVVFGTICLGYLLPQ